MTAYTLFLALMTAFLMQSGTPSTVQQNSTVQAVPAKQTPGQFPAVLVQKEDGSKGMLKMDKLAVDIKIVGNLAITTMDMSFYNDVDRLLEGELNFPLGEGQTVSRFALDINGKMREGVVVEKAKAREVFEKIERQKVDPGILEWTKGNTFRSRVYPIFAKGRRHILVAYEQELIRSEDGLLYTLPLQFPAPIDSFSFHAEVVNQDMAPDLSKSEFQTAFSRQGHSFRADFAEQNFTANKQFSLLVPGAENKPKVFIEERNGETYFSLTTVPKAVSQPKILPHSLCLLWDVSGSGATRDMEKELAVLNGYFQKIGNCTVELVSFSNAATNEGRFTVAGGNWQELRRKLEGSIFDGGTQLGALDMTHYRCDEFLLCTDGISNFGEAEIALSTTPVMVLNSSQAAEHSYLRYIAQKTGGQYLNLLQMSEDDAVRTLSTQTFSFLSAVYSDGRVAELYPSLVTPIHGSFSLAGKLLTGSATVTLNYGFGNHVIASESIRLDKATMVSTGITPRIWAQKKLTELDMMYEKNKDSITALGKEYSIVTRNTSLIVLERIADYIQYRITPPESEPELRQQYLASVRQTEENKEQQQKTHMDYVVRLFQTRKDWWNREFEKVQLPEKKQSKAQDLGRITIVNEPRDTSSRSVYGSLAGTVRTGEGTPVQGATVRVIGTSRGAIVKADGRFSVTNISPGNYQVKVSAVGYEAVQTPVQIGSAQTTEIAARLTGRRPDTTIVTTPRLRDRDYKDQRSSDEVARESVQSTVALSPGVVNTNSQGFSVRGGRAEETQIRIDGLDVSDQFKGDIAEKSLGYSSTSAAGEFATEEVQVQAAGANGSGYYYHQVPHGVVQTADSIRYDELKRKKSSDKMAMNKWSSAQGSFTLKEWNPQTPYLDALRKAADKDLYTVYLSLKKDYATSPGFYLDVANLFADRKKQELALRILSNIAEMKLEDHQLLRILAYRLLQLGYTKLAIAVFQDVLKIREEEPQSYRDLGLAYAADKQYQNAVDMFYSLVKRQWDARFPEVELIALNEMNHVLAEAGNQVNRSALDARLIAGMPVDVRAVLSWDADNCDMDLWVTGPDGEKCFYGHPDTRTGGHLSRDLTGGYGPEEFLIKRASDGKYKVQVHYFGDSQHRLAGPTTVQLTLFTNYGKKNEEKKEITLRLKGVQEVIDVGDFKFASTQVSARK